MVYTYRTLMAFCSFLPLAWIISSHSAGLYLILNSNEGFVISFMSLLLASCFLTSYPDKRASSVAGSTAGLEANGVKEKSHNPIIGIDHSSEASGLVPQTEADRLLNTFERSHGEMSPLHKKKISIVEGDELQRTQYSSSTAISSQGPTASVATQTATTSIEKRNSMALATGTVLKDPNRDIFTLIKHACVVFDHAHWEYTHSQNFEDDCPAIRAMKSKSKFELFKGFGSFEIKGPERIFCTCHGNELQVAIATRELIWVEVVLRSGRIDINKPSGPQGSPLTSVAKRDMVEALELLLTYDAQVNNATASTQAAFREACKNGHYRIVDTFLRYPFHVHEAVGCLQEACYYGKTAVVASLLQWRSKGGVYHRKSLPLNGCVQNAVRWKFGLLENRDINVCGFLRWFWGSAESRHEYDYMRSCAIIEMLIEAGVRHEDECHCGRKDWEGGHRILTWRQENLQKERKRWLPDLTEQEMSAHNKGMRERRAT